MEEETLYDKVYSKIDKEFESFKDELLKKDKEEILKNSYEYVVKEEIFEFFQYDNYTESDYGALLEKDNILEYLYNDWMNCDVGIHKPIEENLVECLYEISNKYEKFEIDKNSKLIKDMTKTIKELNNYNFCDNFLEKNYITKIDKYEIRNILNSKDGVKQLYDFFNDVKDNEQLNYLKEIQVINSESIDNIDKYIPKLKEIINNNKNKSKDMER